MLTVGVPLIITPLIYTIGISLLILATGAAVMGLLYRRCIRNAVANHLQQFPNNQQQLNALINSLNDIIFEFDEDKVCLNAWFSAIGDRGVDPMQLVGKKIEDILGQARALKFNKALDHVIATHTPTSLEYLSDHGTGKWLIAKLTPVFDREGRYTHRISASVSDISEQKKFADALKEKERLLLEAQIVARIGNWFFDSTTRDTYLSANLLAIMGIAQIPDDIDKFQYYLSLVHPDDRETCRQFLFASGRSAKKEFEHRMITPDDQLKYVKIIIGDKVTYDDGTIKRISGIIQDITESKLSEKAIKKGRAELIEAQTIAKIGNWIWDTTKHKLTCSDEIYNIFEVDKSMLTRWGITRLLLSSVHKYDKFILQHLFKSATTIQNYTCVFRIITPGGTIKYLSIIIGGILRNESGSARKIIGTLQDVTERKQVEIDHKRTENKYKLVLETIKLAAISLDNRGHVIFCNQYLANLLGYTQKEILGMHWAQNFIPTDFKQIIGEMVTHNAVPQQYVNPILCRNGEQRMISWQNTVSYDENGLLKETTSIGEDITDQQKATQELISAKEMAERSSKFKSDFLSIMSHEIRTPMNAVIGTTNLLLSEQPRPEQLEYLNILKFSGENLLAIINDILDYNKIEAGKLELNEQKFNIHVLTKKIKQSFYAKALEKNLGLELMVDEAIPEFLSGDQMRLSQIMNNLISNAIKFTSKGQITIDLKAEHVDNEKITIKFMVEDTGIGIAAVNLDLIFDPFTQEPAMHHNNDGGTGLGLAITRRLVKLHQSDISVTSQLGKGTVFSFAITFKFPPKGVKELVPETTASDAIPNLAGMTILVVDDNKMNLLIAKKFLNKCYASAEEAISGQVAIDMVTAKSYDLVIMDLQMPMMTGFEATEIIRNIRPKIPVIALTADAMPETLDKAMTAGMSDYLTKPFIPAILYDKISRYYKGF